MRVHVMIRLAFVLAFISGMSFGAKSALAVDENARIGTVDMQKALQTVEAGKNAKLQLEKEFNAKKKTLQAEEAKIKKMLVEFQKVSLVM
ncbi:MAG: OmpH family outer membrane protein, partial [Bdellovibrionota bacterium]